MKTVPKAILCASLLLASWVSSSSVFGQSSNGIAAVVNGKVVTRSEVRDAVQSQEQMIRMTVRDPQEQDKMFSELRQSALYALIERQLILSEFEKLGGSIRPEYIDDDVNGLVRDSFNGDREKFLQELGKSGMTLKKFREQREKMMIVSVLRSRQTKDLPPPTPIEVETYYKKNADKFRDADFIRFSTITIPKYPFGEGAATPESQERLINEIRAKVLKGSDFKALAKTHSQDSRAEEGGDWGFQDRKSLNPSLAEIVFSLKQGSVSRVIEIGGNFMLIYCEAVKQGKLEPLDTVRSTIEKSVQSDRNREAVSRWLSGLAKKAVIQPESVKSNFLQWVARNNEDSRKAEAQ